MGTRIVPLDPKTGPWVQRACNAVVVDRRQRSDGLMANRAEAGRQPGVLAVAARIVLISNGVALGWAARIRAAKPAMCGAAKLFPVAMIRAASFQATSTSSPYAPNSTGGRGL